MIPYIHFKSKQWLLRPENPFVAVDKPLVVFIDRTTFEDSKDLEFLLMQADGEKLFVISTEKEGNAQLAYIPSSDDRLDFTVTKSGGTAAHHGMPFVQQYKRIATSPDFTRWATPETIERAFITAQTVKKLNAHVFITNDKFLLEHKDIGIITDSYPLNLADATALIGLVQRRRNNFNLVIERRDTSTLTSTHDRWSFFCYASRDLLPSAWPLVTGCAQMPDDKCRDLALTALSRTANALKCRDHIHEQIFLEQTNSSTEDAIFYLDYYLVSFTAAFDVLARLADEIYQPMDSKGKRLKTITWRGSWLQALTREDATLATSMAPGAFNRDVLDFIASLRNYIHEEGLRGAMHIKNGKPAPVLLHVPEVEVSNITTIINRLSGGTWVVHYYSDPHVMFLELSDLVERITPLAIEALDSTMKAIDITKVPGHDPSKVETKAPADSPSQYELAHIRKLLGL